MRRILILAAVLLGSLSFVSAQETANWTILHYAAVDNNLEGAAFNDYYEMQSVGSGEGVNIVTQFDRSEGFENRFGDWTDTRRFLIEQVDPLPEPDTAGQRAALLDYFVGQGYGSAEEVQPQIDALDDKTVASIYENKNVGVTFEQTPVAELGEVDMGDPQSLTDFLVWGVENYPAENYLVVIGSHGGGWRGIGPDEGEGASMLELPEIASALGAAQEQLGTTEKFDIIGFDACFMALTDVAVTLEPFTDYVLSSQELIPSNGLEYTNSIKAMKANPDWDSFQVGSAFIDNYMAYYAGKGSRTKVGLSLVETAGLPNLLASLENFASVVKGDTVELLSALGTARNNSQVFGASLSNRANTYSYTDLKDFMTWFSLQTTISEDAYNAAQEVIAAYDSTVAYSQADGKLPRATGLAIYLPSKLVYYEAYGTDYPASAPPAFAFWQDYLNQFYSTITSELDGSALQLDMGSVFTLSGTGSSLDTPVVFFDAGGKGVVDLSYTISYVNADGTRVIVDSSPISYTTTLPTGETVIEYPNELTASSFTWGVEFPYISDGKNTVLALPQAISGSTDATIQGTYINAEGSQPAYLIFDLSTMTYSGILAVADESPYEVQPQPGDQFIVDLVTLTAENEVAIQPLTDLPLTFGVEPFTFSYSPANNGTYEINLSMTDLADNRISKKVEIAVNNDGVDGSLRGYTDTNEGIHFTYPYAWGASYSLTNDDGSISNSLNDKDGIQSVYFQSYSDTDAQTALDTLFSTLEVEAGEVTETTFGGLTAYAAPYTFATDGGTVSGLAISVDNAEAGTTVIFQFETLGDAAMNDATATQIGSTLQFFAPPA